ncbi:putative O-methyltransferase YrrM [Microbacterium marinum]|uniref:Putative O-methyltransferase YrrM n=1 Tax=Microbacterium marinum TaxID=421115 RepID=A0A7W7BSA7_9MICO|nr:O-methyltransferase [Microbacterium marinum]MBB4666769.1 putative O-methyltransferase YrrM [Microbacterium marinum]
MTHPTADRWNDVDAYLTEMLVAEDEALRASVASLAEEGMPEIEVAPLNGKLLHLLARMSGAKRVLEVGTLGAYSTIWLARALPADGAVVTIEAEPHNAEVARRNLDRSGVGDRVDIRVGRGEDVLPTLTTEEPFDLVFIDADKESNTLYLDWAAKLGHPGTVVVVDNVVRSGLVVVPGENSQVDGVRAGLEMLRDDPRFDATALQTLDRKGWDGIALALVV